MDKRVTWHDQWAKVDQTSDPQWFIRFLDTTRAPMAAAIQRDTSQFFSYLDLREGHRVLDIGAGTGDLTLPLADLVGPSGRVVGLDYSQTMVEEARKRAQVAESPVEFQQGDIHKLDFEDNTFDRCQARQVFQHLHEPRQPLSEMIRVTKPSGKVAVADPDWETILIDASDKAVTRKIVNLICDSLPNGWIGRQLPGLFREAGLQEVNVAATTIVLPPDYDLVSKIMGLDVVLDRAIGARLITSEEADTWREDMQQRSKAGRFFMAFVLFTVTGQKPVA